MVGKELKVRKDKAQVIQTSRLNERRAARETEEMQAEIARLTEQLAAAKEQGNSANKVSGGGVVKELQKQVAELTTELAEARAAYDNVTAGRPEAETVKAGPSAVEVELRRQLEKAQKARDEATAQNTKLQEQVEDEQREIEKLKDQLEDQSPEDIDAELQKKVKVLEQDNAHLREELKNAKIKLDETEEMLAREAKRKQRQIKHLEERADRARDELLSVWEAAQRNSFTASAQNKFVTRALELEKQVSAMNKRIEELEEMGTEAKREAAAKANARYQLLVQRLRLSEPDVLMINEKGLDWPASNGKDDKPLTLFDVFAAASKAEVPVTAGTATPSSNGGDSDDTATAKNKKTLQKRVDKLQEEVADLTKRLRNAQAEKRDAIKELEQSLDEKNQELKAVEDQRQRAEDEIARQKHRAATAVAEAKEKRDELEQFQAKKDKDVGEVEKERTRLQNEAQRHKRRADEAVEEKQRLVIEHAAQLAKVEQQREEAEKSLARLVEHSDLEKAHHEATTSQLVSRIDLLETGNDSTGRTRSATGSRLDTAASPDMQRDPSQGDLAFFKRRLEQVLQDARQREQENQLMIESKLKELEELEQDRDRCREELEEARAVISRMDARVPKASSRSTSRAVSPAPASPTRERTARPLVEEGKPATPVKTRSQTEELAWLQQQKLNVVEGLEKERTRLEAELAQQTAIAQEALLEAGTKREELLQVQSARASELGELEKERHRLEIELGAQAQLALSRAQELETRRNEVATLGRTASELEVECARLRKELATLRGGNGESDAAPSSSNGTPIMQSRLAALNASAEPFTTTQSPTSFQSPGSSFMAPMTSSPHMNGAVAPMPTVAPGPGASIVSGEVRLLVEHLRRTNRGLNAQIANLKDENMNLLVRLAGL
ncbi:hypothetical protein JCM10908_003942 [Rhodotorula pacifica]|uniref:uncharacterized protein n=1 Tax=Rhodotorula pacifica TaxID=1495444 RepID=UPI0031779AB4